MSARKTPTAPTSQSSQSSRSLSRLEHVLQIGYNHNANRVNVQNVADISSLSVDSVADTLQRRVLKNFVRNEPELMHDMCAYATKYRILSGFELVIRSYNGDVQIVPLVYDEATERVGFNMDGQKDNAELIRSATPPRAFQWMMEDVKPEADGYFVSEENFCENWADLAIDAFKVSLQHRSLNGGVVPIPLQTERGEDKYCFQGLADLYRPVHAPVGEEDVFVFENKPPMWVQKLDESQLDKQYNQDHGLDVEKSEETPWTGAYAATRPTEGSSTIVVDNTNVVCDLEDTALTYVWSYSEAMSYREPDEPADFQRAKGVFVAYDMRLLTFAFSVDFNVSAAKRPRP